MGTSNRHPLNHENALMSRINIVVYALVFLFLMTQSGGEARAQQTQPLDPYLLGWTVPDAIIQSTELQCRVPRLAVDSRSHLHMLCQASSLEPESTAETADVIMHRRWDGSRWGAYSDVLASQSGGFLNIGSALVDDQDVLSVIWTDQGLTRDVFLSQVEISEASNARAWSTRPIDHPRIAAGFPHLVFDAERRSLHVVYAKDNNQLVYFSSGDGGATWADPITIWETISEISGVREPRLAIDQRGLLHAVWTITSAERNWSPYIVMYARSLDAGESWSARVVQEASASDLADEGAGPSAGWINIVSARAGELHMAWNRAAGSRFGRFHSYSYDYGETWSNPESFMPEFIYGQTQWPLMEVDSSGTMHLLSVATGGGVAGGSSPKYAFWREGAWSPMYEFPQRSSDLDTAITMIEGSVLAMVHPREKKSGELLLSWLDTGAPREPRVSVRATSEPIDSSDSRSETSGSPALATQRVPEGLDEKPLENGPTDSRALLHDDRSDRLIFLAAFIPVLVLVLVVFRSQRSESRR